MGYKKWWLVVGLAVVFFLCVGMAFIPLAVGMFRMRAGATYYPPIYDHEDMPMQQAPVMPMRSHPTMRGGHFGGPGILVLLPMLACVVFPLGLLVLVGLHFARRHAWKTMQAGGPMPHCAPPSGATSDVATDVEAESKSEPASETEE